MALEKNPKLLPFRVGQDRVPCADLIINIEPCGKIISYPTIPSCYWEIDNHIHLGMDVDKYEAVNKIYVSQKYFMPLYPAEKTSWLPLACDPEKHRLYEDEKIEYEVGFLGNDTYPERKELLDRIGKKYKLLLSNSKPGEEYSRKLSRCKILFNRSMDNDLNMRVFEAISIGRLLLTDKVDGIDDIFKDGEHYIRYKDWQDLDKKIDYYLNHEKEREKIAKTGSEYIHATQTYEHRLYKILESFGFY